MWLKNKSKEKKQFSNDLIAALTFKWSNCSGTCRMRLVAEVFEGHKYVGIGQNFGFFNQSYNSFCFSWLCEICVLHSI